MGNKGNSKFRTLRDRSCLKSNFENWRVVLVVESASYPKLLSRKIVMNTKKPAPNLAVVLLSFIYSSSMLMATAAVMVVIALVLLLKQCLDLNKYQLQCIKY